MDLDEIEAAAEREAPPSQEASAPPPAFAGITFTEDSDDEDEEEDMESDDQLVPNNEASGVNYAANPIPTLSLNVPVAQSEDPKEQEQAESEIQTQAEPESQIQAEAEMEMESAVPFEENMEEEEENQSVEDPTQEAVEEESEKDPVDVISSAIPVVSSSGAFQGHMGLAEVKEELCDDEAASASLPQIQGITFTGDDDGSEEESDEEEYGHQSMRVNNDYQYQAAMYAMMDLEPVGESGQKNTEASTEVITAPEVPQFNALTYSEDPEDDDEDNPSTSRVPYQITFTEEPEDNSDSENDAQYGFGTAQTNQVIVKSEITEPPPAEVGFLSAHDTQFLTPEEQAWLKQTQKFLSETYSFMKIEQRDAVAERINRPRRFAENCCKARPGCPLAIVRQVLRKEFPDDVLRKEEKAERERRERRARRGRSRSWSRSRSRSRSRSPRRRRYSGDRGGGFKRWRNRSQSPAADVGTKLRRPVKAPLGALVPTKEDPEELRRLEEEREERKKLKGEYLARIKRLREENELRRLQQREERLRNPTPPPLPQARANNVLPEGESWEDYEVEPVVKRRSRGGRGRRKDRDRRNRWGGEDDERDQRDERDWDRMDRRFEGQSETPGGGAPRPHSDSGRPDTADNSVAGSETRSANRDGPAADRADDADDVNGYYSIGPGRGKEREFGRGRGSGRGRGRERERDEDKRGRGRDRGGKGRDRDRDRDSDRRREGRGRGRGGREDRGRGGRGRGARGGARDAHDDRRGPRRGDYNDWSEGAGGGGYYDGYYGGDGGYGGESYFAHDDDYGFGGGASYGAYDSYGSGYEDGARDQRYGDGFGQGSGSQSYSKRAEEYSAGGYDRNEDYYRSAAQNSDWTDNQESASRDSGLPWSKPKSGGGASKASKPPSLLDLEEIPSMMRDPPQNAGSSYHHSAQSESPAPPPPPPPSTQQKKPASSTFPPGYPAPPADPPPPLNYGGASTAGYDGYGNAAQSQWDGYQMSAPSSYSAVPPWKPNEPASASGYSATFANTAHTYGQQPTSYAYAGSVPPANGGEWKKNAQGRYVYEKSAPSYGGTY